MAKRLSHSCRTCVYREGMTCKRWKLPITSLRNGCTEWRKRLTIPEIQRWSVKR